MKICGDGHEFIIYVGELCPACEAYKKGELEGREVGYTEGYEEGRQDGCDHI